MSTVTPMRSHLANRESFDKVLGRSARRVEFLQDGMASCSLHVTPEMIAEVLRHTAAILGVLTSALHPDSTQQT